MGNVTFEDVLKYESSDFQGRGGNYPKSGEPTSVSVYEDSTGSHVAEVVFSFKNTSEEEAKNWVRQFAREEGLTVADVVSSQEGDYDNDWVDVVLFVG